MDITPFLNRTLDIPLYQQLYRYFKENMHRGRIQKGMKLALNHAEAFQQHDTREP